MTQNKLHKLMPFLALAVFLMFSIGSDAQRSRRNRNRLPKDTTVVDTLGTDTIAMDTLGKLLMRPVIPSCLLKMGLSTCSGMARSIMKISN